MARTPEGQAGSAGGIVGVVTSRTVLTHPALIVRLYGFRTFARCLVAIATGAHVTFLSLVWGS